MYIIVRYEHKEQMTGHHRGVLFVSKDSLELDDLAWTDCRDNALMFGTLDEADVYSAKAEPAFDVEIMQIVISRVFRG